MFIDLMAFLVLPCTIVLIYLFLSYDIEKGLVPLSQYVHSMAPSNSDTLTKLELNVLRDDVGKAIMEGHESAIRAKQRSGLDGDCVEFIRIYREEWTRWGDKMPSPPAVGLISSLWPMRLQLSKKSDPGWKRFAAMWFALLIPSLLLLLSVEWFLGNRVWMDIVAMQQSKPSGVVEMTIESAHFLVVAVIFGKLAQTIMWVRFLDSPAATPRENCPTCSGTGQAKGWLGQAQTCTKCNGTGHIILASTDEPYPF